MIKYFLDRNGNQTKRIAGKPGSGHIEIAMATEVLDPDSDVYQQMHARGYARVVELDTEIHVDAPQGLTRAQTNVVENRRLAVKKPVNIVVTRPSLSV